MPIRIENDHMSVSLNELVALKDSGYSVLKSPHVGNQHPSNLACAALGIGLEMVSFTIPGRDRNFHPHLRIAGGETVPLFSPSTLTQFATVPDGRSATTFHQQSVQAVFPRTEICTDMERMRSNPDLTSVVLRESNRAITQLWYRWVCSQGQLTAVKGLSCMSEAELESNVFQLTNDQSGWVTPNRVHMLFDFVWQSLSSGRDVIYHLSGPQMVGYIGGVTHSLGVMYDTVRAAYPGLPEVLTIRIVPVASCRFLTLRSRADALSAIQATVRWYEALPPEDRRYASERFAEVLAYYPEFVQPIESAATLSQYDLIAADDLLLDSWMCEVPLSRVRALYARLVKCGHSATPS